MAPSHCKHLHTHLQRFVKGVTSPLGPSCPPTCPHSTSPMGTEMGYSPQHIWGTIAGQDLLSPSLLPTGSVSPAPTARHPQASVGLGGWDGSCPVVGGTGRQDKSQGGRKRSDSFTCSAIKAAPGVGAAVPAPQHRFN